MAGRKSQENGCEPRVNQRVWHYSAGIINGRNLQACVVRLFEPAPVPFQNRATGERRGPAGNAGIVPAEARHHRAIARPSWSESIRLFAATWRRDSPPV